MTEKASARLLAALERALNQLADIRYCTWPPGVSEAMKLEEDNLDQLIIECERAINYAKRNKKSP